MEQWKIGRRDSQARSILCNYGNQVETSLSCGHTCTQLGISIAGEVVKRRTKKPFTVG